jgi:alkanesulfonate monooxygenase SsuD/methylene tetrahydromethanopterin reductase-like flavin-dependent oxidoreductase (luciferase family)
MVYIDSMGIFGRNQKPKARVSKKKSFRAIMADTLVKEAQKDPELRKRLAFHEAGYDAMLATNPEADNSKKDLEAKLTKRALQMIDEDPDLRDEFAQTRLRDLIDPGGRRRRTRGEDGDEHVLEGSGEPRSAIDIINEYRLIEEEFGGKKSGGALGGLIDADVIKELIRVFGPTLANRQPGQPPAAPAPERMFVVPQNGHYIEMPESQWREFQASQQALQAPPPPAPVKIQVAPTTDAPPEPTISVSTDVQIAKVAELPAILANVDFGMLEPYLVMTPDEVAQRIMAEAAAEGPVGTFLWNYLPTATFADIEKHVGPFRNHPKAGLYATYVLDNREWMEQVIVAVRQKLVG